MDPLVEHLLAAGQVALARISVKDATYLYATPAYAEALGYTSEALAGTSFLHQLSSQASEVIAGDPGAAGFFLRKYLANPWPTQMTTASGDSVRVIAQGTIYSAEGNPAEAHVKLTVLPGAHAAGAQATRGPLPLGSQSQLVGTYVQQGATGSWMVSPEVFDIFETPRHEEELESFNDFRLEEHILPEELPELMNLIATAWSTPTKVSTSIKMITAKGNLRHIAVLGRTYSSEGTGAPDMSEGILVDMSNCTVMTQLDQASEAVSSALVGIPEERKLIPALVSSIEESGLASWAAVCRPDPATGYMTVTHRSASALASMPIGLAREAFLSGATRCADSDHAFPITFYGEVDAVLIFGAGEGVGQENAFRRHHILALLDEVSAALVRMRIQI